MNKPFALLLPLLCLATLGGSEVGEVVIRTVVPLDSAAIDRLRRLATEDGEAAALLVALRADADRALDQAPTPIAEIYYEGKVNTDPKRIACCEKLADLDRAAAAVEAWAATGDARYAQRALASIEGWAATYRPTGNGINENKLQPLLAGWLMLRGEASPATQGTVDAWVRALVEKGLKHEQGRGSNWGAKRIALTALGGRIAADPALIAKAGDMFRSLVAKDLRADGTSHDLEERDSMGYHSSCVRSLTLAALIAGERGWWSAKAPSGASLELAARHLLPYVNGEKIHREWVNTRVDLDRRRAAAGIPYYQPGRPYDPRDGVDTMVFTSAFLPEAAQVAARAAGRPDGARYANWTAVWMAAFADPG